eukprot:PITA_01734
MVEEYESIMKNSVWEEVQRPEGKSVADLRWIYKVKHVADGDIEKCKARFVAKGISQIEGVDYEETFAPVARYSSIRSILALVAQMGWKIHQMDVKTVFLNGVVEEEIYKEKPQGFETYDRESHVCKLKRALYVDPLLQRGSCKEDLARDFKMKYMGLMHYFLELEVWQGDGELFVSQGKYATEILQRFHMENCKPMDTPLATN